MPAFILILSLHTYKAGIGRAHLKEEEFLSETSNQSSLFMDIFEK